MLAMKLMVSSFLLLALSAVAFAYPHCAFLDIPVAITLGDRGYTGLKLGFLADGPIFQIGRAIDDRIDVRATITPQEPFSMGIRALLLRGFGPLNVALDLSGEGLIMIAALSLGPLRIDWGRTLGKDEKKWGTITASKTQWFSLVLGLEHSVRYSFLGGVRFFPGGGCWGLSILMQEQRWTVSVGGIF